MRKKLKVLSAAVALSILAAIALTGCGAAKETPVEKTEQPAGTEATATAADEAAPASAEPEKIDISKEVKLYGYLLGAALPGMPDVMEELNKKLKEDLNCTMEINYIGWADLSAKYPLVLAAGQDIDWIFTAGWCQYPQQAAKGAFMEITEEIYEKYMPLHWARIKDTTALKDVTVNGKTYMIPTSAPDKKVTVALFREDLRKKYGVPEIKKFSDIEPYLEAIKKNESGMIPLNLESSYDIGCVQSFIFTEQFDAIIDPLAVTGGGSGIAVKTFTTDGKLYLASSDPEILPANIEAAKITKSWYDKGYINRNPFANKVRSKEALVQGKSAVGFGNSIDVVANISQCEAAGMEIGIIPILPPSGKAMADTYLGNGVAIAATSENWERTLMAMDLIMEREDYVYLTYCGVEGKHYVVTDDGKIANAPGVDDSNHPYALDAAGFWFVNRDMVKPLASWSSQYIELKNSINDMMAVNPLAGFAPNTEGFKTEQANCAQVIAQYGQPIGYGAVKDVEEAYKTLDAKLRAAGVEKIMEDLQKQINEYLAANK